MAISIVLPRALHQYARGSNVIALSEPCSTVADALASLAAKLPAVTDRVLTEQGELRPHVNVFVGTESVRFLDGLATELPDGATLTIVPAVSGG
ncbi:MAG TPA: ubiquitin-like small modifier protein 1 [Gemmatimonadaceae bacterium]